MPVILGHKRLFRRAQCVWIISRPLATEIELAAFRGEQTSANEAAGEVVVDYFKSPLEGCPLHRRRIRNGELNRVQGSRTVRGALARASICCTCPGRFA